MATPALRINSVSATIVQGTPQDLKFQMNNPDGTAPDLHTGWVAHLKLAGAVGDATEFDAVASATLGADGTVTFHMTATEAGQCPCGNGVLEIHLSNDSDATFSVGAQGTTLVKPRMS